MQLRNQVLKILLIGALALGTTYADAPSLQTPTPVIYLADNLDENDNLGWCIDTVGRGFADSLHAHSCKPNGGDVQFAYSAETLQITTHESAEAALQAIANNQADAAIVDAVSGRIGVATSDDLQISKIVFQPFQIFWSGATPGVDRLVVVTDHG